MPTNVPPFANEAAYVAVLAELVPDTKADRADADFIDDGLQEYAEHNPAWKSADIGDGSTTEWELGDAGDFAAFELGYADLFPIQIEELDSSGNPQDPAVEIHGGWRIVERWNATDGDHEKYLVFRDAPAAAAQYRVMWRARWALVKVPTPHQLAVVYFAASLKCTNLATYYRKTVDAGSDLFDGISVAEGYERDARKWRAKALSRLGIGGEKTFETGRARPNRSRVFHRGRIP